MTCTTSLITLDSTDLNGADKLRLWAQKYGGDVPLSLSALSDWLSANIPVPSQLVEQYAAPATGATVAVSAVNTWLILRPTATIATATITLPSGASKAEVLVTASNAVTALTVTPASGEAVQGAPTTLAAGGYFRLRFDGVYDTWCRVA